MFTNMQCINILRIILHLASKNLTIYCNWARS